VKHLCCLSGRLVLLFWHGRCFAALNGYNSCVILRLADGALVYKAFVIVTRWLLIRCGLVVERGRLEGVQEVFVLGGA
jgi:hypothetical protein